MRVHLLFELVVAEPFAVGILGGSQGAPLQAQGILGQHHDHGQRQGIIEQQGHGRVAPPPALGIEQQDGQAGDEDDHEDDQQPDQRRGHLFLALQVPAGIAACDQQHRPADDFGADEGRKRIDDERGIGEAVDQPRGPASQQHADHVDGQHGDDHHETADPAAQAQQHHHQHRQQREHHIVRQTAQPAAQRDGRVQQREAVDDPTLF